MQAATAGLKLHVIGILRLPGTCPTEATTFQLWWTRLRNSIQEVAHHLIWELCIYTLVRHSLTTGPRDAKCPDATGALCRCRSPGQSLRRTAIEGCPAPRRGQSFFTVRRVRECEGMPTHRNPGSSLGVLDIPIFQARCLQLCAECSGTG